MPGRDGWTRRSRNGSRNTPSSLLTLGAHLAFVSVLYLGSATLFGYRPDVIGWLLAAVASLLSDIDLPPAEIGRLFWFVFVSLERRFGHRRQDRGIERSHSAQTVVGKITLIAVDLRKRIVDPRRPRTES